MWWLLIPVTPEPLVATHFVSGQLSAHAIFEGALRTLVCRNGSFEFAANAVFGQHVSENLLRCLGLKMTIVAPEHPILHVGRFVVALQN